MKNNGFDFVGVPLRYKVTETVKEFFTPKKDTKIRDCYDRIYYFKTVELKDGNFKGLYYIVFYTDSKFIIPPISRKQFDECVAKKKGYIAFQTVQDKNRGLIKQYLVKGLDRAHSFPKEMDLEKLIDNGLATQLF